MQTSVALSVLCTSIRFRLCVKNVRYQSGADPGICEMGAGPSRSLPFPFSSPLEAGPLKADKGSGGTMLAPPCGSGRSPGRKRIWCTVKHPESHWYGIHFEYCEYHILQKNDQNLALANMTVSDGISPSPKGGGAEPTRPLL